MNKLRELRIEKRLTLRDLAEKLNMSYSNIAMIERGERKLSEENIAMFAKFFDVSSDYLLGYTNVRKATIPNPTPKEQLQGIKLALFDQVNTLSDDEAADVLKYAKFIKSNIKE